LVTGRIQAATTRSERTQNRRTIKRKSPLAN
jgi:hypothetical protein